MYQVGMSLETQHRCNTSLAAEFDFTFLPHSVEGKEIMGKLASPAPSCCILIFLSHIDLIHTGLAAKLES